jgi:hypothetical protein
MLSLLWNLPVRFSEFTWRRLAAPTFEISILFALLALASPLRTGRRGQIAAVVVALATALVVALKAADLVIYESLGRPLNPLLDLQLACSLVDLLTEALGGLRGWLCLAALALIPLLVFAASFAAVRGAQRALAAPFARHAMTGVCAMLIGLFAVQQALPQVLGQRRPVSDQASLMLLDQWHAAESARAGMAAFETAIAHDPFRTVAGEHLPGARHCGSDLGRAAAEGAEAGRDAGKWAGGVGGAAFDLWPPPGQPLSSTGAKRDECLIGGVARPSASAGSLHRSRSGPRIR